MSFESLNMFCQLEMMIIVESIIITIIATERERSTDRRTERTKHSIMHVYYRGKGLCETCLDI